MGNWVRGLWVVRDGEGVVRGVENGGNLGRNSVEEDDGGGGGGAAVPVRVMVWWLIHVAKAWCGYGSVGFVSGDPDSAGSADPSVLSRVHFLLAPVLRWLRALLLAVRHALRPHQRGLLVLEPA